MEADGYVRIVGRIKDMIIRGGENISPREIEEALACHPAVSEAQVVGVPSRKYGEEVMAWIQPRPGGGPRGAGAGELLPGAAGAVQGAALLAVRRDVPHDGDGQDPASQAARDGRRAARTPRRRRGGDRLKRRLLPRSPPPGPTSPWPCFPRRWPTPPRRAGHPPRRQPSAGTVLFHQPRWRHDRPGARLAGPNRLPDNVRRDRSLHASS